VRTQHTRSLATTRSLALTQRPDARSGYLFTLAGERVVARLRKALFAQIISLEIAFFDESQTGELLNRLSSDTAVLQDAVTVNVSMGLRFAAQARRAPPSPQHRQPTTHHHQPPPPTTHHQPPPTITNNHNACPVIRSSSA